MNNPKPNPKQNTEQRSPIKGTESNLEKNNTRALTPEELQWADKITLYGISATGYHGVYPEERQKGQLFSVDVTAWTNTQAAALSDDLSLTVDYSQVANTIVEVISGPPVWLIERLAEQVAAAVLGAFPVLAVQVTVHKPQAPMNAHFTDVQVQIFRTHKTLNPDITGPGAPLRLRPVTARQIVLALGANLGDPVNTLRTVVEELRAMPELQDLRVSPLARSAPVLAPTQPPQPDYYNAIITARTRLSAMEILELAHRLENHHGRVRDERWGARTLDIDVIQVEGLTSDNQKLTLPHPRAAVRAFVLQPWLALDPGAQLNGEMVAELLENCQDRDGVARLWPQWLEAESATGTLPAVMLKDLSSKLYAASDAADNAPDDLDNKNIDQSENMPGKTKQNARSLPSWRAALQGEKPRIVDDAGLEILTQKEGTETIPFSDTNSDLRKVMPFRQFPSVPRWRQVRHSTTEKVDGNGSGSNPVNGHETGDEDGKN